jgi:predicted phosphodiesterase
MTIGTRMTKRQRSSVGFRLIRELLDRQPDLPSRAAARKLYHKTPEVWSNLEACRSAVRYYRGTHGPQNRRNAKRRVADSRAVQTRERRDVQEIIEPRKFAVPLPTPHLHGIDRAPIPCNQPGIWGIMSDIHIPFHDASALETALSEIEKSSPVGIILLGDVADFHAISRWENDPRNRDFEGERQAVVQFLKHLRERFPTQRIVYKLGNHEERLERFMLNKAPELLGMQCLQFRELVEADSCGIEVVGDQRRIALGRLTLIHGHEYRFAISNPVGPARGLFLKSNTTAMCGHFHQTSQYSKRALDDVHRACWSLGALCQLDPEYRPINEWNHGFAIVTLAANGTFEVSNRQLDEHGRKYA